MEGHHAVRNVLLFQHKLCWLSNMVLCMRGSHFIPQWALSIAAMFVILAAFSPYPPFVNTASKSHLSSPDLSFLGAREVLPATLLVD